MPDLLAVVLVEVGAVVAFVVKIVGNLVGMVEREEMGERVDFVVVVAAVAVVVVVVVAVEVYLQVQKSCTWGMSGFVPATT